MSLQDSAGREPDRAPAGLWRRLQSSMTRHSQNGTASPAPGNPAAPARQPTASIEPASETAAAPAATRPDHTTWEAEAFIPVSRFEIADQLVANRAWGDVPADTVRRVFRYLSAWRHVVYKERLDELEQTYLPYSPETDLLRLGTFTDDQRIDYRDRFLKGLRRLLRQANYIEVLPADLHDMMNKSSLYGLDLRVDLSDFEECIVYRRGTDIQSGTKRSPWTLYLWDHPVRFAIYQRLCVVLKLWPEDTRITQVMTSRNLPRWRAKRIVQAARANLPAGIESAKIYIKLFKDIPHSDLEMLFPNTQVRLSRLDKIRIGGSAASGVGIGLFGLITNVLTAAVFSPYALVVALFGIGTVMFRQIMGFFNQRTQYMKVLAQNLYFHSLADNRSAFTLLANRAEEEDVKEEMLLYSILATEVVHRHELPDVKAHISSWLREHYEVDVDFEAEDALNRLMRDGIVQQGPDGRLTTLAPAAALRHYDTMWDSYLQPEGMDRRLLSEDMA